LTPALLQAGDRVGDPVADAAGVAPVGVPPPRRPRQRPVQPQGRADQRVAPPPGGDGCCGGIAHGWWLLSEGGPVNEEARRPVLTAGLGAAGRSELGTFRKGQTFRRRARRLPSSE